MCFNAWFLLAHTISVVDVSSVDLNSRSYVQLCLIPVVAIKLFNHTLSLLIKGCYGRVAPPLVKVAILVVLATCAEKNITHRHTKKSYNPVC